MSYYTCTRSVYDYSIKRKIFQIFISNVPKYVGAIIFVVNKSHPIRLLTWTKVSPSFIYLPLAQYKTSTPHRIIQCIEKRDSE